VIVLLAAIALVADERAILRAAPREASAAQAQLARGDWLEVRGELPGWLRVYDHRRERPGFVRPIQVRVHDQLRGAELRAVVRFLRDAAGQESLGIAYAALWMKSGDSDSAAEVNDAVGVLAERLAQTLSRRVDPRACRRSVTWRRAMACASTASSARDTCSLAMTAQPFVPCSRCRTPRRRSGRAPP
jgi:hypothetical protein